VFVLAGILLLVSTAFEPAKNALLPDLAPDPAQLTASNVVTNTFESTSMFAGPALGGLLLAVGSIPLVFVVSAGLLLISATLLARLPAERERASGADAGEGGEGSELTAGIRTVLGDDRLRLMVGMMGAQTLVSGLLSVLVVVVALDLLDMGNGGVGLLDASVGVGGLIGGVTALSLAGGRRLAPAFGLGMVLWGVPIALIAAFASPAAAVVLLAVVGIGNTFVDISAITLLQR